MSDASAVPGRPLDAARHEPIGRDDVFFAAVEMTQMPVVVTDPNLLDNPLVFANQAFLDLCGYSEQEVIGRNCRFMQGPGTDPATVASLASAVANRTQISVEVLNYRKGGQPFWNALFVSPVFDADGNLVYYFGSQLDVTRRREAEAAVQRAQRMEALGQLTGGLAHDFNNLLQVVIGSLEMLRPSLDAVADPRVRRRHEGALQAARQGAVLTRQLLAFARRQRLDGRPVDMNDALEGMTSLLERSLGAIRLGVELAQGLPPARLDVGQLEAALVNLVLNSREALPVGGEVVLATRLVPAEEARAGFGPDEETGGTPDFIEVAVRDNGPGIAPDILDRVTEPFFTTKEVGRGSGLGLAQVYGFVRQSGGHLRIESSPGGGTVVRLRFPAMHRSEQPPPPRNAARRVAAEPVGGRESILIVDDNVEVLELAESVLSDLGYTVATAPNGPLALARLADPAFAVDLLFTDIVMPGGMNGIRLANEARQSRPQLRVLLSTGYVDPNEWTSTTTGRQHGFPVVAKPYRRTELARRVREVLDAAPKDG